MLGEVQALVMGQWKNYTSTTLPLCLNLRELSLTFVYKNVLLLLGQHIRPAKLPHSPSEAYQCFNQAAPDLVLEMKWRPLGWLVTLNPWREAVSVTERWAESPGHTLLQQQRGICWDTPAADAAAALSKRHRGQELPQQGPVRRSCR